MSEHQGSEPVPDWVETQFPDWEFVKGWVARPRGNPEGPQFVGDSPEDLRIQIVRAAWEKFAAKADARSGP